MSSVSTIEAKAPQAAQPGNDVALNAYVIILMALLGNMDAQQNGIKNSLEREQLLKVYYDEQKNAVAAEEAKLKAIIAEGNDFAKTADYNNPEDLAKLQEYTRLNQSDTALVQHAESELSSAQNRIVQEFKRGVDPSQEMIKNDSVMFGGVLHSYRLTEKTK
jgi:hypothetical protein